MRHSTEPDGRGLESLTSTPFCGEINRLRRLMT